MNISQDGTRNRSSDERAETDDGKYLPDACTN